ncbi:MAG: trypsin-like peptidase domain-containing protein [Pirellulales bacterium]|nr:trypsin-like peptidase domain-containing protein [Pirellulales bacterium]
MDHGGLATFTVVAPKDAVLLTVKVTDSPLILDILADRRGPIRTPEDAEYHNRPDSLETSLSISRQSRPALESGVYHLAVGYLGSELPVVHKHPVKRIPFKVTVSFVRANVTGVLRSGEKTPGRLIAEEGSVRMFAVDIPPGTNVLRIDLDEVESDLDILARYGRPILRNEDAEETAVSGLGRESLVLGADPARPLKSGRWYVNVVHPTDSGSVDFTVYTSFSAEPPAALLAIPPLPLPTDSRKRALYATVEITTDNGSAAGTLVTDDGLVLTNYHVVAEVAENPPEQRPVVVSATLDPRQPPRELFRGRVTAFDKKTDLALIHIDRGFYGQPLPADYRFPAVPLGDPERIEIGDPLCVIGFPFIGGSGGRVSVTLTRGVVSGFEKTPFGTLIKTDAGIGPGNSGGAALNDQWQLIGVPTSENVDPEAVSRMSYIHPLTLLRPTWREKIDKRRNSPPPAEKENKP